MLRTDVLFLVAMVIFSSSTSHPTTLSKPTTTPPPPPRELKASECEFNVTKDKINGYLPPGKSICTQQTNTELFVRLQKIGGYNPEYTAVNETVAEHFPDPRLFLRGPTTTRPPTTTTPTPRTYYKPAYYGAYTPTYEIPWYKSWYNKPWNRKPWNKKPWQKRPWHNEPYHGRKRRGRRSADSKIITVKRESRTKACWATAQAVQSSDNERFHLCGECHVVTTLDNTVTPRLLNEAVCKHGLEVGDAKRDTSKVCAFNSGLCMQRILRFPALRETGIFVYDEELSKFRGRTIHIAKWDEFTQDIKAGCQCQMFRQPLRLLRLRNGR